MFSCHTGYRVRKLYRLVKGRNLPFAMMRRETSMHVQLTCSKLMYESGRREVKYVDDHSELYVCKRRPNVVQHTIHRTKTSGDSGRCFSAEARHDQGRREVPRSLRTWAEGEYTRGSTSSSDAYIDTSGSLELCQTQCIISYYPLNAVISSWDSLLSPEEI